MILQKKEAEKVEGEKVTEKTSSRRQKQGRLS